MLLLLCIEMTEDRDDCWRIAHRKRVCKVVQIEMQWLSTNVLQGIWHVGKGAILLQKTSFQFTMRRRQLSATMD